MRALVAIAAAANTAFILGTSAAWAQPSPDQYGPHMMWWGGGYGMFLGPLFMIFGLAVAIALGLILVRWSGGPLGPPPPGKTALDILKERFARGDIDKAEYEDRRRTLGE
jgi:putative membrane protein